MLPNPTKNGTNQPQNVSIEWDPASAMWKVSGRNKTVYFQAGTPVTWKLYPKAGSGGTPISAHFQFPPNTVQGAGLHVSRCTASIVGAGGTLTLQIHPSVANLSNWQSRPYSVWVQEPGVGQYADENPPPEIDIGP